MHKDKRNDNCLFAEVYCIVYSFYNRWHGFISRQSVTVQPQLGYYIDQYRRKVVSYG